MVNLLIGVIFMLFLAVAVIGYIPRTLVGQIIHIILINAVFFLVAVFIIVNT